MNLGIGESGAIGVSVACTTANFPSGERDGRPSPKMPRTGISRLVPSGA